MKIKYVVWTAVAALIIAGGAAFGFAQMQHRHAWYPGMMGERFMAHMARYLNLTEAQQAEIKSMWQAEKPAVQPLLQQLANGRKQMLAATANGTFDEAKVRAIANQQSQTLAQLIVEKEKLTSEVYNKVLTPEQRTKVDQMRQKQTARVDQWLQHLANPNTEASHGQPQ